MSGVDMTLAVLGAVAGVGGSATAIAAFTHAKRKESSAESAEDVHRIVREDTEPYRQSAQDVTAVKASLGQLNERVEAIISRTGVLETKIDVFWKNVAFDAARILHQPHPGRQELDDLLDEFEASTLTADGMTELKAILMMIRDYKYGARDPGFPVFPGDQIAAAVMLRVIENQGLFNVR